MKGGEREEGGKEGRLLRLVSVFIRLFLVLFVLG